MAEFTPITTQEEFDTAIGARIKRERDTVSKEFAAQLAEKDTAAAEYEKQIRDLNKSMEDSAKKYEGFDQTLADLKKKVSDYETSSVKMRIAHEIGIPYELAGRLSGSTEDEIRKDAESLSKLVTSRRTPPLKSTESELEDSNKTALKNLAKSLTSKGE